MSQQATLDRFGWKDWEIRNGVLYNNQLSYRYHWTPANLITPLFNVTASDIPWRGTTDNLSSIEEARRKRNRHNANLDGAEKPVESTLAPQTPQ
jgi:hypothetical protein